LKATAGDQEHLDGAKTVEENWPILNCLKATDAAGPALRA
jgi:hypothetical protein